MATQQQIADHLDLDQSAVSRMLDKLGIDWKTASVDEVRIAYIRQLRAQAAGHRTEDGLDLVRERVLTERVDRELKLYTLAEKKGTLINVAQLETELGQMFAAFRIDMLAMADKLKADIDAQYGIDIDMQLLNDHAYAALNHFAGHGSGDRSADGPAQGRAAATGTDIVDGLGEEIPTPVVEVVGAAGQVQP